jgi:hypothetical protein
VLFPDSIDDFLLTISPAFNLEYLESLGARCDKFDRSVGDATVSISDCFISEMGFKDWICGMCMAIALDCFETPHRKHQPISQYDDASGVQELWPCTSQKSNL